MLSTLSVPSAPMKTWTSTLAVAMPPVDLSLDEACTRTDPLGHARRCSATLVVDPREDELVVEASAACDTHDVVARGS